MRSTRLSPLALLAVAGVLVAACASAAPGWTYAPAPSITPPPSVEPSVSAEPSMAPSASAPASAPASGEPTDDGTVLEVVALNLLFEPTELTAPADEAFKIDFANDDPNIPHNVSIRDGAGAAVFDGETFNGVDSRVYDVPALAAGTYQFLCIVHPTTMVGTLTVGG